MRKPGVWLILTLIVLLEIACREDSDAMKINFRQSGGYAASASIGTRACELDTDSMTVADAESLRALVRNSGLLEMQSAAWKADKGADVISYQITIEVDREVRKFSMDDMSVPEKVVPLLEYLLDRCQ